MNNPQSHTARDFEAAAWQVPSGVSKGNWDYVRAGQIAAAYDENLNGDPLTEADWKILNRYLPKQDFGSGQDRQTVADFGCGTGRSLEPLIRRGYHGLALDLSIPMLAKFGEKIEKNSPNSGKLLRVQANLVELAGINTDSIDHGICLYSTLGMIKGRDHRNAFLNHARRIIKPGGQFILHVHNVWYQLTHRHGFRWAVKSAVNHLRGSLEFGDRVANYRGVNNMFIHSFRMMELKRVMHDAGFHYLEWFGVVPGSNKVKETFPLGSSLKYAGWIIVAK